MKVISVDSSSDSKLALVGGGGGGGPFATLCLLSGPEPLTIGAGPATVCLLIKDIGEGLRSGELLPFTIADSGVALFCEFRLENEKKTNRK